MVKPYLAITSRHFICQDFYHNENCNLISNVVTIMAIAVYIAAVVGIIDLTIEVCIIKNLKRLIYSI